MPVTSVLPTTPKKPPLDIKQAFKLRFLRGLTFQEIADKLGFTRQAVSEALKSTTDLFANANLIPQYFNNETNLLKSTEAVLLQYILDPAKLEKASTNNIAYAYDKVRAARTGHSGGGAAVTIELVFQDAEKNAKKIRQKHDDIIIK